MASNNAQPTPAEIAITRHKAYLRTKYRPLRTANMPKWNKGKPNLFGLEVEAEEDGESITYDATGHPTITRDNGDTIVVRPRQVAYGSYGGHGDPSLQQNADLAFRSAEVNGKKYELPFLHSKETATIDGATYWRGSARLRDEDRELPKDMPRCRVVTVLKEHERPKDYLVCANEGECKACEGETGLEEIAAEVETEYAMMQKNLFGGQARGRDWY